jgi:hypothetical protein
MDRTSISSPTFSMNVYFSVITFSTIEYGDLSPAGAASRILVGVEFFAGATLVGLLVFVLGRCVSRQGLSAGRGPESIPSHLL